LPFSIYSSVKFKTLQRALIDQPEKPKGQSATCMGPLDDTMALKIINAIKEDPSGTINQISEQTGIARRTLIRHMKKGRIERIGGKRYGHWQINE